MTNDAENDPEKLLDEAMRRALEADRLAALSVAESRAQAEEIVLLARREAAAIEARADRRMAMIQKERAKTLRRMLESMGRHQRRAALFDGEEGEAVETIGLAEVGEAARRLAVQLTGGGMKS
ncbi:MAG: hypothetical protein H7834_01845 [Magnetococcus sp. YQC-9]